MGKNDTLSRNLGFRANTQVRPYGDIGRMRRFGHAGINWFLGEQAGVTHQEGETQVRKKALLTVGFFRFCQVARDEPAKCHF